MVKILILDSQRSIRNNLKERLEFEGYSTETADQPLSATALTMSSQGYDIIISEESFFYDYVSSATHEGLNYSFIVTSDSPSLDSALNAVRHGAIDFISKPIDMNCLLASIKRVSTEEERQSEGRTVHMVSSSQRCRVKRTSGADEIIGESKAICYVNSLIEKVAPSEARVLVTGPNGSGKEMVAHWLHLKSSRANAPFVEVNCAAIPGDLIESELFGHEKGSFTSAIKQRKGKFEQANGGTLFLDEVGDMSLPAQAKVLRALQENRISRVGGDKDINVDVRIVAATNKDLRQEINEGRFREDLYHRLSVILIPVPPLCERLDDVPLLVDHFLNKISLEYNVPRKEIEKAAIEILQSMPWTGNIRELRNVVERLLVLSDGPTITAKDVKDYAFMPVM